VEDVMLKGHPLPQIRYALNRMQNGMKTNHSKIQPNQVEAATSTEVPINIMAKGNVNQFVGILGLVPTTN